MSHWVTACPFQFSAGDSHLSQPMPLLPGKTFGDLWTITRTNSQSSSGCRTWSSHLEGNRAQTKDQRIPNLTEGWWELTDHGSFSCSAHLVKGTLEKKHQLDTKTSRDGKSPLPSWAGPSSLVGKPFLTGYGLGSSNGWKKHLLAEISHPDDETRVHILSACSKHLSVKPSHLSITLTNSSLSEGEALKLKCGVWEGHSLNCTCFCLSFPSPFNFRGRGIRTRNKGAFGSPLAV